MLVLIGHPCYAVLSSDPHMKGSKPRRSKSNGELVVASSIVSFSAAKPSVFFKSPEIP